MDNTRYITFFDDRELLVREGLTRDIGSAEEIKDAVYFDGVFSTDYHTGFVFKREDGWYMVYFGKRISDGMSAVLIASSSDGIHFAPYSTEAVLELTDRIAPNEVYKIEQGAELATIYEDMTADAGEKYKMLIVSAIHNWNLDGYIFVSDDLIHWSEKHTEQPWNSGCEPITNVFYNRIKNCHTIVRRPLWGQRSIGYVETQDFSTFTDFEPCMQVDPLDGKLDEMYGMSVLDYHGRFIGFNVIYGNLKSGLGGKYNGGSIYTQLSYSNNGRNWQRTLRKPFMKLDTEGDSMQWYASAYEDTDGSVVICASATPHEHGPAFSHPENGRIRFYRVRKDGFIYLKTEADAVGTVATRDVCWNGGQLGINICAGKATVAIYENRPMGSPWGKIVPLEGFTHEDCEPFSGDSTCWIPKFKGDTDSLRGKTVIIEIKLEDGKLYSVNGDLTPLTNTQALRYRAFGVLPEKPVIY